MTSNIKPQYFILLLSLMLVLTGLAFSVNLYYQYPGNNYLPENTGQFLLILTLIFSGSWILTGKTSHTTTIAKELLYFFLVMLTIALATNAVQLTPFATIDHFILVFEKKMHIDTPEILAWTYAHPQLQYLLAFAYSTLPWQMCVIPLFVIFSGKFSLIREYYFLILCAVLSGFLIYYFFPTMAPASILQSKYFTEEQFATGFKFLQIHQHQPPTTLEGGLIAFPSFHVIWAWLCLYLVRFWPLLFYPLLLLNTFLIFSCLLLGWHYFLDLVMSILILAVCHYLLNKCREI